MLKMLLDPMGGILLTNDGNAILREVDVSHPAAKSMIELSRTQDEEVGDGTTSVIILGMQRSSLSNSYSWWDAVCCSAPFRAEHSSHCDCSCLLQGFGVYSEALRGHCYSYWHRGQGASHEALEERHWNQIQCPIWWFDCMLDSEIRTIQ